MSQLTTADGIKSYLATKGQLVTSVKELTGGTANFVWRVTGEDGQTSIVKHAEPYIKNNPAVSFSPERMAFEARSMVTIGALLSDFKKELTVSPPDVISHDLNSNVLMMSDGQGENLKALYLQLAGEQVRDIGRRLGSWLAALHERSATHGTAIGDGGNQVARSIYQHSYRGLSRVLAGYGLGGFEGKLGTVIRERYATLLETDDSCVCMGDFWTGNVIVNMTEPAAASTPLMVVDWEMCRRGVGATDAAQFVAEAYLLDRFSASDHGLASSFLESYAAAATMPESFWERFLVHWAVHVIFWPAYVPWAGKDELKKLAEHAVGILEVVVRGSEAEIKQAVTEFRLFIRRKSNELI